MDRKGVLFLPPSLLPGRENRHVWAWILCSSLTRHFRKGSLCVPSRQLGSDWSMCHRDLHCSVGMEYSPVALWEAKHQGTVWCYPARLQPWLIYGQAMGSMALGKGNYYELTGHDARGPIRLFLSFLEGQTSEGVLQFPLSNKTFRTFIPHHSTWRTPSSSSEVEIWMLKSGVQGLGDKTQHQGQEHRQEQTHAASGLQGSHRIVRHRLACGKLCGSGAGVEGMTLVATVLVPSRPGWFSGCTAH